MDYQLAPAALKKPALLNALRYFILVPLLSWLVLNVVPGIWHLSTGAVHFPENDPWAVLWIFLASLGFTFVSYFGVFSLLLSWVITTLGFYFIHSNVHLKLRWRLLMSLGAYVVFLVFGLLFSALRLEQNFFGASYVVIIPPALAWIIATLLFSRMTRFHRTAQTSKEAEN